MPIRRFLKLVFVVPLFALGTPACDSPTGVCTLRGCDSGLVVQLSALPAGPFSVEVFAVSPNQLPSYRYECDGTSPCEERVLFSGLQVSSAYVQVTTPAGAALQHFPQLRYETIYPNGRRCGGACQSATVAMEIPAASGR